MCGSPPPRSAHQAVIYKFFLFVFGGEFTSPNQVRHRLGGGRATIVCQRGEHRSLAACASAPMGQGGAASWGRAIVAGGEGLSGWRGGPQEKFYHYKDVWRLDLTTNEWECLPLRGGPSARSGHRMALLKGGRILLFGGYYDVGAEMKCDPNLP